MTSDSAPRELSVIVGSLDAAGTMPECLAALQAACEGIDAEILRRRMPRPTTRRASRARRCRPHASSRCPLGTLVPALWGAGPARGTGQGRRVHDRPVRGGARLGPQHCSTASGRARRASAAGSMSGAARERHRSGDVLPSVLGLAVGSPTGPRTRSPATTPRTTTQRCSRVRDASGARSGKWKRTPASAQPVGRSSFIRARPPGSPTTPHSARWPPGALPTGATRARFVSGAGFERDGRWCSARPLVPFVLLARVARRVARAPGHMVGFVTSLGAFLVLATAWAAGEAIGGFTAGAEMREALRAA